MNELPGDAQSEATPDASRAARAVHNQQVLFDKEYLRLTYDPSNRWLHAQWQGHLTLAKVYEGSQQVLELVRAHQYRRLLNDNTAVTCLDMTPEEQRGYQIMDQLFAAGLHYLAWVYAPVEQGRTYAENSIASTDWPLVLSFEELGPAIDWLRQMP